MASRPRVQAANCLAHRKELCARVSLLSAVHLYSNFYLEQAQPRTRQQSESHAQVPASHKQLPVAMQSSMQQHLSVGVSSIPCTMQLAAPQAWVAQRARTTVSGTIGMYLFVWQHKTESRIEMDATQQDSQPSLDQMVLLNGKQPVALMSHRACSEAQL